MSGTWRRVLGGCAALLLQGTSPVLGRPVEEPPAAEPAVSWMRAVGEPGRSMALEVAARRFAAPAGTPGPDVLLVGVVHIGERSFYERLQTLLGEQDLVLYESVMPPGARGAAGGDPARRPQTTRNTLLFVSALLGDFRRQHARFPADFKELKEFALGQDPRLVHWLEALADGWGRPIEYALQPAEDARGFVLRSPGADGRPGGSGEDEDLVVTAETPLDPEQVSWAGSRIQAELAAALGLSFQLDAVDYGQDNFRCSDMDLDQLEAALRAEGAELGEIAGGLTGTSLFGRFAVFLLRMVRVADVFLEGAIADSLKVTLIELFSDEKLIDELMAKAGPGLAKVLIEKRNQVVADDLKAVVAGRPGLRKVAIFYGAGHMADLAKRLEAQFGYRPAETEWVTAMKVDLAGSAMGAEQLENIRRAVRRQMRFGW